MKSLKLFFTLSIALLLFSCGGDDDYVAVDTTPSAPQNLIAIILNENSLELQWNPPTQGNEVIGYNIYQDDTVIFSNVTETQQVVTSLEADSSYTYYVTAVGTNNDESEASNLVIATTDAIPLAFEDSLTDMGVFQGTFSSLTPAQGVQLYEINSTLFTDYAAKQRLIRLPEGKAMEYTGSDLLPDFPNNTLIAKTFYYNIDDRDPSLGKQIIETRIFLKINGVWEAGDYIWNEDQTDATYRETSSVEAISYIDIEGNTQNISYEIPSKQDCATCHNNNGNTFPIGLKLRSMNFTPANSGNQNQLQTFIDNETLTGLSNPTEISVLPDWTDEATYTIFERARAYMDVNCAHCHQPGGEVTNFAIDFRYETPQVDTGIYANRGEIEARTQSTIPTYRMPQLGRTIVHEEAVAMLIEYLDIIEE
ncbi:hypothetical protein SCB49_08493 [unidentified eubacterium SCB49]|nr:hypothetical protein SCB49_08493 [unidentified eubacterium SCB49]